jgi:hypothetical protein
VRRSHGGEEIVPRLTRKMLSRNHKISSAGNPRTVAAPSHTGKMANWTAAAMPIR